MSGPEGNDDDEQTNVDAPIVDLLSQDADTSVGAPPEPPEPPPDEPAKPVLAVVHTPPPTDSPAAPAVASTPARTLTPVSTPPRPAAPLDAARERTRTPAPGQPIAPPTGEAPPPPEATRERTRTPPAGRPITPPPPPPEATRERTRTPPVGRPIAPAPDEPPPPPAIARTKTPAPVDPAIARTKTPVPGRPIAPGPDEPPPPPAIARTKTPAPVDPAIARTKTPAPGRPIAPGPDEPPPPPAIARTKTPAPVDAARERTKTPAPGRPIAPAPDEPPPPPAIARTKTPAPVDPAIARTKTPVPGRPITPTPDEPPPPPAIARTKTPAPVDAARERTKTPAPGRPIAPAPDEPPPPPAIARTKTPAPVDAARERTKTPAPGRPITPAPDEPPPPPAIARTKTPAPVDAARERTKTPAPGRPIAPAPDEPPPPPAIARTKTPAPDRPITPSPEDPATAITAATAATTPAPGGPITPPTEDPATAVTAATAATPPAPDAPRPRAATPAPTEPRERTKTPAPGRAITPVPDEPRPRAATPAPTETRERTTTPAPASRRAASVPPTDRAITPLPFTPARAHRASTNPPGDRAAPAKEARSLPTASIPDTEPWAQRIARILPWVIVALPALFQLFLLSTAITGRLMYPYDLEWMEGGMLHHAQRIHGGLGVYVAPSIEFIPYLYTPLYPSLLALFGGAFGLSYTLGRAFSVLALIGIAVVAAVSIANPRHQHARRAPAWGGVVIALGLFAAAYPYMEGWYDLVRADTLFLFMVTAALAGLPRWAATGSGLRGHGRVAAGAVLLALAFFCKQTGIIYVAFGGLIVLVVAWRRVPIYVLMAGLIGLGGTWLLQLTTDGWFWIYIRKIHAAHDFNWDRFWKSFENILWHFPAMSIVIAAALVIVLFTVIWRRTLPRATHPLLLWSSTFVVSTLLGAIGWGTEFAHFNAYMPAFLHGALAAGAAIPAVYACARVLHGRRKRAELVTTLFALAAAAPLALACWQHRWDPKKYMPTQRDVEAGDRLIARIRAIDGDVWMPSHPWYLELAGKSPRVHRMGVKDVTWRQTRSVEGLEAALQHHAFAALVLDGTDVHNAEPATISLVNASYRAAFKLPADERPHVFTGAKVSPDSIWLPAIPARPPPGTRVLFDLEQIAWEGWTLSGAAWGGRPETELAGHGLLIGATGRKWATSMHGGDIATGRVTSPAFVVDGKVSVKLGGGTDATKLRVELWVAGAIVATAGVPAPGGDTLRAVTLDPGASRGAEATLVLVDDSSAGHLDVDDVWLTP